MKRSARITGMLLLLLGVVGILLCAVGIAESWNVRNQLDDKLATTFARVDEVMVRLNVRAGKINDRIDGVQESLQGLDDRVQQRVADLRDVSKEDAADIDELERQLYARVQQVMAWHEFIQSTTELVDQLMGMVESTSAFVQEDSRTTRDLLTAVRSGREELDQTSLMVEELKLGLIEVRARRNVDENSKKITSISSRIDASLTKVQGYGQTFESGVASAQVNIDELGQRIRWKLLVIAIAATIFLIWMAAGQLGLACRGRKKFTE